MLIVSYAWVYIGSGKTLAFLLPLVINAKRAALKSQEGLKALVISPTRELAEQTAGVLLLLVRGLRLQCCLLTAAAVVASIEFSKVLSAQHKNFSRILWLAYVQNLTAAILQAENLSSAPRCRTIYRLPAALPVHQAPWVQHQLECKEVSGAQMDLAVTTPLRMSKVARSADLSTVRWLILDEADKLFEEGLAKQTDRVIAACIHPRLVGGTASKELSSPSDRSFTSHG